MSSIQIARSERTGESDWVQKSLSVIQKRLDSDPTPGPSRVALMQLRANGRRAMSRVLRLQAGASASEWLPLLCNSYEDYRHAVSDLGKLGATAAHSAVGRASLLSARLQLADFCDELLGDFSEVVKASNDDGDGEEEREVKTTNARGVSKRGSTSSRSSNKKVRKVGTGQTAGVKRLKVGATHLSEEKLAEVVVQSLMSVLAEHSAADAGHGAVSAH